MQGYCYQKYYSGTNESGVIGWVVPFLNTDGTTIRTPDNTRHYRVGGEQGSGPFMALHGNISRMISGSPNEFMFLDMFGASYQYLVRYVFAGHSATTYTFQNAKGGFTCSEVHIELGATNVASSGGFLVQETTQITQMKCSGKNLDDWKVNQYDWDIFESWITSKRRGAPQQSTGRLVLRDWHIEDYNLTFETFSREYQWFDEIKVFSHPSDSSLLSGINAAYHNAVASMPEAEANGIANVFETVALLTKLIRGDIAGFASSTSKEMLSNLWLGYRYSYQTTLSDVTEYASLTRRLERLASLPAVTLNGYAEYSDYLCHVSVVLPINQVVPEDTLSWLRTYGVKLSLYNAWDMVPFSFMIDWFTNIGGLIRDLEIWSKGLTLHPRSAWSSITRNDQKSYLRWQGSYYPGTPILGASKSMPGGKTLFFRLADFVSIFG